MEIKQVPSPNKSSRRGVKPSTVVIHATIGSFAGAQKWLTDPKTKVSAHYIISKKGEVVQLVPEIEAAWHVCNANPFTIGIELEDAFYTKLGNGKLKMARWSENDPDWLTDIELVTCVELTVQVMKRWSIPVSALRVSVIGHNNPSLKKYGNTHTDPGPWFPWAKFYKMIEESYAT